MMTAEKVRQHFEGPDHSALEGHLCWVWRAKSRRIPRQVIYLTFTASERRFEAWKGKISDADDRAGRTTPTGYYTKDQSVVEALRANLPAEAIAACAAAAIVAPPCPIADDPPF